MTLFVACECPDPWAECKCPPFTEDAYRKEVAVIVDTLADFDTDTLSVCERQGPHGQAWAIVEADRAMKLLRKWSRLLDRLASVVSTYPADAGGFGVRIHRSENLLLAHEYLALAETATRVRRAVLDYLIGDSGPATAVEPWVQFSNGATIELWPRHMTAPSGEDLGLTAVVEPRDEDRGTYPHVVLKAGDVDVYAWPIDETIAKEFVDDPRELHRFVLEGLAATWRVNHHPTCACVAPEVAADVIANMRGTAL